MTSVPSSSNYGLSNNSNNSSAIRALQMELKSLQTSPVEGFTVVCDDENIFKWNVGIFGAPETIYQGGYFKAELKFPSNYPYSPPTMRFLSKVWHPNVYENGDLCISILHPPIDDPHSGEMSCERWNPTQSVRTILLSVISLLNEPNTSSPANVDASVSYRKYCEGKDDEYYRIIKNQIELSKVDAINDNVIVPLTLEEYCIKSMPKNSEELNDVIELDEDYYECGEETDVEDEYEENDEDSGQGEN